MRPRHISILWVHEFGIDAGERMQYELASALAALIPSSRMRFFNGFLRRYIEGGMHPLRIINMLYMYLSLPFVVVFWRPDYIIIRTTPPGIQIWGAFIGCLFRVKVACWLMDYHPEIEAVRIERQRGFSWLASGLRRVDALALHCMHFVVVLDDAMEVRVRSRVQGVPIIQHPTWGGKCVAFGSHLDTKNTMSDGTRAFTLVYAGNLGHAHPLGCLERVLRRMREFVVLKLVTVGASIPGECRFKDLGGSLDFEVNSIARVPFVELRKLFAEKHAKLGLVLLSDETMGLVAPSKFSGYLVNGIPILYIGPKGTASYKICSQFGAGFHLCNNASDDEIDNFVRDVLGEALEHARMRTKQAHDYFDGLDARSLAHLIVGYFT